MALLTACGKGPTYDLAVEQAGIIDLQSSTIYTGTLLIQEGKIERIVRGPLPERIEARNHIDARGKYAMPGLWDMHVHLVEEANHKERVPYFLKFGITSVRDAGGSLDSLVAWNRAIENGKLRGPNIYYAGPTLNGPKEGDAAYTLTVDDTQRAAQLVDSLAGERVHFIKVHDRIRGEVLQQVTQSAGQSGLPVAGHLPYGTTPRRASELGMRSLEHISALVAAQFYLPRNAAEGFGEAYNAYLGAPGDSLYATFTSNGTMVTPTLVTYEAITASDPDPQMRQMGARALAMQQRIALQMSKAGVPLLAGSDFGATDLPLEVGDSLLRELILLSEAGIDSYEVLRTATEHAARFFGLENRTGHLESGYTADLLLLDANPVEDMDNIRSVALVIKSGKIVYRP